LRNLFTTFVAPDEDLNMIPRIIIVVDNPLVMLDRRYMLTDLSVAGDTHLPEESANRALPV
jgi:hypothetical protein